MTTMQIYDPALCCSTGICGVEVNQNLITVAADIDWAKQQGASIERFNLGQQPMAFADNAAVKAFLERWTGVTTETKPASACCSGSKCC